MLLLDFESVLLDPSLSGMRFGIPVTLAPTWRTILGSYAVFLGLKGKPTFPIDVAKHSGTVERDMGILLYCK